MHPADMIAQTRSMISRGQKDLRMRERPIVGYLLALVAKSTPTVETALSITHCRV